jgi:uncharacterized protein
MAKTVYALAFADSHGVTSGMQKALEQYSEGVEYMFHMGDYAGDADFLREHSRAQVMAVRGNCDFISDYPYFDEIVLCGHKIILTHGHKLNAKYSTDRLLYYAQEREAKAILFGHTHVPLTEYVDGVWLINPGSITEPRAGFRSVASLMIGQWGVVPKIMQIV